MHLPFEHRVSNTELLLVGVVIASLAIGIPFFGYIASGPVGAAVIALVLVLILIAGSIAFAVRRARSSVYPALDDGGVRLTTRLSARRYIPFAEIRSAEAKKLLGRTELRLDTKTGPIAFTLAEGQSTDIERLVQQVNERARTASSEDSKNLGALVRGEQTLNTWLGRVRQLTSADYRGTSVDPSALMAALEDPSRAIDVRAAAAHALVALGDGEKTTRVMSLLNRETPPLVTVAAALVTARGTYVAELEEALSYLSTADRALARRMLEERPARS
jgi:hypothetical protein